MNTSPLAGACNVHSNCTITVYIRGHFTLLHLFSGRFHSAWHHSNKQYNSSKVKITVKKCQKSYFVNWTSPESVSGHKKFKLGLQDIHSSIVYDICIWYLKQTNPRFMAYFFSSTYNPIQLSHHYTNIIPTIWVDTLAKASMILPAVIHSAQRM